MIYTSLKFPVLIPILTILENKNYVPPVTHKSETELKVKLFDTSIENQWQTNSNELKKNMQMVIR